MSIPASAAASDPTNPQKTIHKIFDDVEVEFSCNPEYIQNNEKHYWFRILSPELEDIRIFLGFSSQPVEVLNNGSLYTHPFHLTIGRIFGK